MIIDLTEEEIAVIMRLCRRSIQTADILTADSEYMVTLQVNLYKKLIKILETPNDH